MIIIQYMLMATFILWGVVFGAAGIYVDEPDVSVRLQALQLSVLCFIALKLWLPKKKK